MASREEVEGLFANRADAGRRLAEKLSDELPDLTGQDVVVVGLPRGGVPVAFEVARALGAPLDVLVVRKLGAPSQPELALGAVGEGGVEVLQPMLLERTGVSSTELAQLEGAERAELRRQASRYRHDRPAVALAGRTVVVVDDGVATGATARAACQVAGAQGASRVVLAVPVASGAALAQLRDRVEVVSLATPSGFRAVGEWYDDFSQVSDRQVRHLLRQASGGRRRL